MSKYSVSWCFGVLESAVKETADILIVYETEDQIPSALAHMKAITTRNLRIFTDEADSEEQLNGPRRRLHLPSIEVRSIRSLSHDYLNIQSDIDIILIFSQEDYGICCTFSSLIGMVGEFVETPSGYEFDNSQDGVPQPLEKMADTWRRIWTRPDFKDVLFGWLELESRRYAKSIAERRALVAS